MNFVEWILNLIFPPRCFLCGKILKDGEKNICEKCADVMPRLLNSECRRDIKNVTLCMAPFQYKDELRESLHRYKFNGAAAYGRIYAEFIVKSIDENAIICDIISWVPLSKRGFRKRGYDQAELIARALAERLGLPCESLLLKTRDTKRQSLLTDRGERQRNVSGAYCVAPNENVFAKRVLLVDDIVTTGSTLAECARVLKNNGCLEVYGVAAAMVK